ncbi:hypothetical protein RRG08_007454 [Elysia crispata]|uniref:Uncharacterized protein n=1 Tax=Elysia crispata TaxID=231223 RepID=A0AAE1E8N9_9GAST|nr:hypothetical protein RRG08_007454 [Elysia crispata]
MMSSLTLQPRSLTTEALWLLFATVQAGFVPVQINNDQPIVKGRKITAFSNAEEDAIQLSSSMPFMLETKLKEQGGQFTAAPLWEKHVVVG